MQTQVVPVLLNLVAAVLGAFGQYFYNKGSKLIGTLPIWKNLDIFAGCLLFCGVMVFFVVAYKLGGKMSVVYPFYASTFIWAAIIAVAINGERINGFQWAGILAVTLGTAAIAFGQGVSHG